MDSGATMHMTRNLKLLEAVKDRSGTVLAANNRTMQVKACGTAKLYPAKSRHRFYLRFLGSCSSKLVAFIAILCGMQRA